jgi:hypothetical protein
MPITHLIDPQVPNYQDLVTKGIYPRTFSKSIWSAGGSVALATAGTDVACTDGTTYFTEIYIPTLRVLTGVFYLIGSVGGTNSVIVTLYDNTGAVLANSLAAGTTVGTAANIQSVAFTSTAPPRSFVRMSSRGLRLSRGRRLRPSAPSPRSLPARPLPRTRVRSAEFTETSLKSPCHWSTES